MVMQEVCKKYARSMQEILARSCQVLTEMKLQAKPHKNLGLKYPAIGSLKM